MGIQWIASNNKKSPVSFEIGAFSIRCHSVPTFRIGKQTLIPFYQNRFTPGGDTE
jgi:hypothetical protein